MKIEVLGPGCMKCNKLFAETEKAIAQVGKHADLSKVDKIEEIMKRGVMMTPALVINGKVKSTGKVPNASEIAIWIKEESTPE